MLTSNFSRNNCGVKCNCNYDSDYAKDTAVLNYINSAENYSDYANDLDTIDNVANIIEQNMTNDGSNVNGGWCGDTECELNYAASDGQRAAMCQATVDEGSILHRTALRPTDGGAEPSLQHQADEGCEPTLQRNGTAMQIDYEIVEDVTEVDRQVSTPCLEHEIIQDEDEVLEWLSDTNVFEY
jgi:hypothetical protein